MLENILNRLNLFFLFSVSQAIVQSQNSTVTESSGTTQSGGSESSSDSALTNSEIAGIVISSITAVIVFIAVVSVIWWRKRNIKIGMKSNALSEELIFETKKQNTYQNEHDGRHHDENIELEKKRLNFEQAEEIRKAEERTQKKWLDAAKSNNLEKLEELYSATQITFSNVNCIDDEGYSASHYAAKNDNRSMLEFLIEKGTKINTKNGQGETPLHIAAKRRDIDSVLLLLEKNADGKSKDSQGKTPFDFLLEFYLSIQNKELKNKLEQYKKGKIEEENLELSCAIPSKNPYFVPWRRGEKLKEAFNEGKKCIVISGLSGSGKTELALDFAHDYHENYNERLVYILDARDKEQLKNSYLGLIRSTKYINDITEDIISLDHQLTACVKKIQEYLIYQKEFLLVFDNHTEEIYGNFLPDWEGLNGTVIITTISSKVIGIDSSDHIELCDPSVENSGMNNEEAHTLFKKILEISEEEYRLLDIINMSIFEGLPLAISTAAIYLRERYSLSKKEGGTYSYENYLKEFHENRKSLQAQESLFREKDVVDYKQTQIVTIQLLLKFIKDKYQESWELLTSCIYLQRKQIPHNLLHSFYNKNSSGSNFDNIISVLSSQYSLLKVVNVQLGSQNEIASNSNSNSDTQQNSTVGNLKYYTLHECVHYTIKCICEQSELESLDKIKFFQKHASCLKDMITNLSSGERRKTYFTEMNILLDHSENFFSYAKKLDLSSYVRKTLFTIAKYLQSLGKRYQIANNILVFLVSLSKKEKDFLLLAKINLVLVSNLSLQDEYYEAINYGEQGLTALKNVDDEYIKHKISAQIKRRQADVSYDGYSDANKKYKEAMSFLNNAYKSLAKNTKRLEKLNAEKIDLVENMNIHKCYYGYFQTYSEKMNEVKNYHENHPNPNDHPEQKSRLQLNDAEHFLSMGEFGKAKDLAETALKEQLSIFGEKLPVDYAYMVVARAYAYIDPKIAHQKQKKAEYIQKEYHQENSNAFAIRHLYDGIIYYCERMYEESIVSFNKTLSIYDNLKVSESSEKRGNVLYCLARSMEKHHNNSNNTDEAIAFYKKSLSIYREDNQSSNSGSLGLFQDNYSYHPIAIFSALGLARLMTELDERNKNCGLAYKIFRKFKLELKGVYDDFGESLEDLLKEAEKHNISGGTSLIDFTKPSSQKILEF